ncbi:MBL fold metallo-hydrolase [Arthrobacter bambusae]|uniref:MBL fold metallo-hydrolase n=1 Tax=Arthrobacter bambusae TaxID=1338426 RepID=UPI00278A941B|nr:MBL fold metallo-hydrolase [Arthrobacter bambusae]MDQ0242115.1 glyoxylase-like metal-dependent hydrolase (beta-lactamase superfamily II) [Arthrobacter bambusae]
MDEHRPDAQDKYSWETPGAHEVADGVYRIPLPMPQDGLRAVSVYAVVDGGQLVLIDGGWAIDNSIDVLAASLREIGFGLSDISQVLVTHSHRDHYTQAVTLRRLTGAHIRLGRGEQESVCATRSHLTHFPADLMHRLVRHGAGSVVAELRNGPQQPSLDPEDWEDPDSWLSDGLVIKLSERSLTAIATPGHTRGHMVFYDPAAKLMFSGDHILPHITPSIGFEPVPPASPLGDYLASLEAMFALGDCALMPAHGPSGGSSHARARALLDHHDVRLAQTLAAVGNGARTGMEAAAAMPWTSRQHSFAALDPFNQMIAVNETIAHLDVLAERQNLTSDTGGATIQYSLNYNPAGVNT